MQLKGVGEPAPADLAEQWVGGHLFLDVRAHVGDQPEDARPALLAIGVIKQHKPPRPGVLAIPVRDCSQGGRVRRQPPRRRGVLEGDVVSLLQHHAPAGLEPFGGHAEDSRVIECGRICQPHGPRVRRVRVRVVRGHPLRCMDGLSGSWHGPHDHRGATGRAGPLGALTAGSVGALVCRVDLLKWLVTTTFRAVAKRLAHLRSLGGSPLTPPDPGTHDPAKGGSRTACRAFWGYKPAPRGRAG